LRKILHTKEKYCEQRKKTKKKKQRKESPLSSLFSSVSDIFHSCVISERLEQASEIEKNLGFFFEESVFVQIRLHDQEGSEAQQKTVSCFAVRFLQNHVRN